MGPGKSCHESRDDGFELNDLHAVVFAAMSVVLFGWGLVWWPGSWLGPA